MFCLSLLIIWLNLILSDLLISSVCFDHGLSNYNNSNIITFESTLLYCSILLKTLTQELETSKFVETCKGRDA